MFGMKKDKVLEFIERRFPTDSRWMDGNCYFFALILKDVFDGKIYYDVIEGHFLCLIKGKFYDWNGIHGKRKDEVYVKWDEFKEYDSIQHERIIKNCCR